ncbi:MAG: hypothetical protein K0R50_2685 [Eubacterium sp.]|jgi:uncharacterized protein with FMN-binding domain|nr:hypothetical protein [Eubacterium sp.]
MKRLLAFLIICALAAGMSACAKVEQPGEGKTTVTSTKTPAPTTTTPTPGKATPTPGKASPTPGATTKTPGKATPTKTVMKDGTYDAKGDPWENGEEEATVVIKDGKISQVTLKRLDKTGKEVDYNLFNGKVHDGKTYPNLKEFKETLAKKIVEKQSTQVDTISGATTSTKNWLTAVERAIAKAQSSS